MGRLNESEFKVQIKSGEYSPAYFIYGSEGYLKQFYVDQLIKKLAAGPFEDFNLHKYDGKKTPLGDILKDADLLPLMSEYNLVVACDYPFDKSEADCKAIKEYLKDVSPSTILVFWYNSVDVDIKKNSKWKGVEAAFSKAGSSVLLEPRTEVELAKLIVSGCKKRGAAISSENARYLISVSGSDIKTLLNETEKLSAYANGGEITKQLIDKLAVRCLQAKVFDLSKAVVRGDYEKAYSVLDSLFAAKEEPVSVLAVISNCFVDMYRVKCAKTAGFDCTDVGNYYNYKGREFALRNAMRDCSSLSVNQLRDSLDVIMQADSALKSTGAAPRLVLEEALVKLLLISKEVRYD